MLRYICSARTQLLLWRRKYGKDDSFFVMSVYSLLEYMEKDTEDVPF